MSKKKKKEAEVIELQSALGSRIITQNLNRDVFSNMGSDSPLETYSKVGDFLAKRNIEVAWYPNYEYKTIDMMSPDDPIYDIAQCRAVPEDKRVEEFRERFNKGEKLIWAPMAMVFEGKHVLAFGNTRYRALSTCDGDNSIACYAIIDPHGKLPHAYKKWLLSALAAMSNVESEMYAKPDSMEDYPKQAKNIWATMTSLRGKDMGAHTATLLPELEWLAMYDSMKTADDRRQVQKDWFNAWMSTVKPNKYTDKIWRSILFNQAFGEDKEGNNSLVSERTDAQRKNKYDSAFPDDIEFNEVRNSPTNLAAQSEQWHMYLSWGTKGDTVMNCVTNLDGRIFRDIRDNNAKGKFKTISIVMKGFTGARKSAERINNVKTVIKGLQKYNNSLIVSGLSGDFPIVNNIVFPAQLRDANRLVDRDFVYKWDASINEFEEINKPLVDIKITKFCSTCAQRKGVENFNILRKGKDGLQPRCKDCHKKKEKAA